MYLLYMFPPEFHSLMTSLTRPRKIILVVLEIGKGKDLSASLRVDPASQEVLWSMEMVTCILGC
jgi:hypothetical protein